MAGLFDQLYREYQNSRFKPVHPPLDIDGYALGPGVRFGFPWPWAPVESFEVPHGTEPVVAVETPRTDTVTRLIVWRDTDATPFDQVMNSAGNQLASLHSGRLISLRKVLLDRSRAVVAGIEEPGRIHTWRILAEWRSTLVHGQLSVPMSAAGGYQPQLDTMLGTWAWA